jgi:transcription elongation factor Elf1
MNTTTELTCPQCEWSVACNLDAMLAWLRRHGRLRRADDVDSEFVKELFSANAGRFSCPECGSVGLAAGPPREDEEDWVIGRACEVCGKPISAERIEIFPDAKVCAGCKEDDEAGRSRDQPDYCPRCGGIMQLRPTRGHGISRYQMVCPDCGRK